MQLSNNLSYEKNIIIGSYLYSQSEEQILYITFQTDATLLRKRWGEQLLQDSENRYSGCG